MKSCICGSWNVELSMSGNDKQHTAEIRCEDCGHTLMETSDTSDAAKKKVVDQWNQRRNFVFREHRRSLGASLATTIAFPDEQMLQSLIKDILKGVDYRLAPKRVRGSHWLNERAVIVDKKTIGYIGEIPNINAQQRIIYYLADQLAKIANVAVDSQVTFADIIELAESKTKK